MRRSLSMVALVMTLALTISTGAVVARKAGADQIRPLVMSNVKTPKLRDDAKEKRRKFQQADDDLNKLEARIALLWARVQEIESKALATIPAREEGSNA